MNSVWDYAKHLSGAFLTLDQIVTLLSDVVVSTFVY